MNPYRCCEVIGPYARRDGRKHVCVRFPGGQRKTVSYPKYLKEIELGRFLDDDETVDHNDQNFRNDSLDNLIVRKLSDHAKLDARRLVPQTFICPVCQISFTLEGRKLAQLYLKRNKDQTGPYCGKSCAGKHAPVTNRQEREYTDWKH